jgi:hypothetical protein
VANDRKIKYSIGFDVDTAELYRAINEATQSLNKISSGSRITTEL